MHNLDDSKKRPTIYSIPPQGLQANSAKDSWQIAPPFPIANSPQAIKIAVFAASQCKTQLEAALMYAWYGIPVIPCNWKPVQLDDGSFKIKKYPLNTWGVYGATIDPEQIKQWWTKWPLALIGVPGGRRTGLWFHDVDSIEGHGVDGLEAWSNLQSAHGPVKTRVHKTGTNGEHNVFLWDANRPIECSTGKLPGGMEVKGEGGYVIFPPSPYEVNGRTVRYSVVLDDNPEPAPGWLVDLILGARSKGNGASAGGWIWSEGFGQKKLEEYCELIRTAAEHHWDEACRKLYMFGRWTGGGATDINVALEALLRAAIECRAPVDYPDNVKRAFLNGVANPAGPFIEEALLNNFCAYMHQHSYIYIPTRELWPVASIDGRIPSVDKGIKASRWLDQNRHIEQLIWAPGEEMLVRDRLLFEGGWIPKQGDTCFNLYRGPTIEPGDAGKADPWIEHTHKVFGNYADHIIKWCAQRKQHPEIKINHALVIGSEQHGTGKDTMLEPVKRAIGSWNFSEVNPHQIFGRFNGFFKSVILRINEARDLGDVNRYQFYDHMKTYIAAPPDVLRIDEKNMKEYSILNCVGIIITTNYKTTGIYLPAEDRRHYVAWSDLGPGDFTEGYWNRLWKWYDAGGDRHVAAYLAGLDLSGFDPKAPPPKTQAFWDIVEANRSQEDSELADVLDRLKNPAAVTVDQVVGHAGGRFGDWLRDNKNKRHIANKFELCGYERVRNPDREDGADMFLWRVAGVRQVVYALKELSRQEQLAAVETLIKSEKPPSFME